MYDERSGSHGRPTDPQTYARSHPLRLAILAALDDQRHPCTIKDLRAELPEARGAAVIAYHLGVLRRVGLVSEGFEEADPVFSLA